MSKNNVLSKIWHDPTLRGRAFQVIFFAAAAAFITFIVDNTLNNIAQRGIPTGFDFLGQEAGFSIIQSLIDYSETDTYARTFIVGILNTLLVSSICIILATFSGFLIGISRLSNNWLLSKLATLYIEIFRNIPLLLQVFFWYFAVLGIMPSPKESLSWANLVFLNIRGLYLPNPIFSSEIVYVYISIVLTLIGLMIFRQWARKRQEATGKQTPVLNISIIAIILIPSLVYILAGTTLAWDIPALKGFNFKGGITVIPEFTALVLALTIYSAAFIAENVRSGLQSVPKGQLEAAKSLGLKNTLTLRLIVIPQAMRLIIPPLTNQYLTLLKNSSLATAIGYPDLVSVFAGTALNQSGKAIEIISMVMAVYLTFSITISLFMNYYNSRTVQISR